MDTNTQTSDNLGRNFGKNKVFAMTIKFIPDFFFKQKLQNKSGKV